MSPEVLPLFLFAAGLPTEPQGLQGENMRSEWPVVPVVETSSFQQPRPVTGEAAYPLWHPVRFFVALCDSFRALVSGYGDCDSDHKAELQELGLSCVQIGPDTLPSLFDRFECQCCGKKTRGWIIATFNNGECVCRECWPEYARVRYPKCKQVSYEVANSKDGEGPGAARPSVPRRYFLHPTK